MGPAGPKLSGVNFLFKIIYLCWKLFTLNRPLGDSRKYPYYTTDGFHILPPPPCLQNFQIAVSPQCPRNSITFPSLADFPFFSQILRKYLYGSQICPNWLILLQSISNDSNYLCTSKIRINILWWTCVYNCKVLAITIEYVICYFCRLEFEPPLSAVAPNPTSFKILHGVLSQKTCMFCIEWTKTLWDCFPREKKGCFVA